MGRTIDTSVVGDMTKRTFLRRYWQKRPLFVRGALPDAGAIAGLRTLRALAARDDVESRIAVRTRRRWKIEHGPFEKERNFPDRDWTLLVSGVNLHVEAADRLLRRFSFIPQARLDDVMVSYAAPGGGVGPHVDSYDVFLIQGPGRRRWTVWHSGRRQIFDCAPGDLLYLPPGLKHDGVALEPCYTYSVGFRAPRGAELGARFLDWLHERGLPDAIYGDPGLEPAARSAAIPPGLLRFAARVLKSISWQEKDVQRFLGQYLTEPKAHVVFRPGRGRGPLARLDSKTQLLYRGKTFFINGEALTASGRKAALLRELADGRELDRARAARAGLAPLLYDWRRRGYLHFGRRAA